ncbi:MAG: translocation/assembly module TamB domain-containing protein [Burkholderiaceae bacterium]|nr:translocation/assembly module TamB domain-containing protein [Burkholderiaceae bacterium]
MSTTLPRSRRARRRVLITLALLTALLAIVVGLVLAGLRTAPGTAWLLARAPGLQIEQPEGSLLGDFAARRMTLTLPGIVEPLVLTGLRWQDLTLEYSGLTGQWLKVRIAQVRADRLDITLPASSTSSGAPANLWLPLELEVQQLRIGEIHSAALGTKPLRRLDAAIHLGARAGAEHGISLTRVEWDGLLLSGKALQASRDDLQLDAQLLVEPLTGATDKHWQARLELKGPLAGPTLQAQLSAAQQSLQASARLQPFAAWPLAELQARTRGLNLAALNSDWPRTALSGEAQLSSKGWDQPAALRLNLSNSDAGRWDQQRLPLQAIALDLEAVPNQAQSVNVRAFDLQLGLPGAPAGRLQGQGGGKLDDWRLSTRISQLQPAGLDKRLAALNLNGTLELQGSGGLQAPTIAAQAQLLGQWLAKPAAMAQAQAQLSLDAVYTPQRIRIKQAQLSAGTAQATAQATLDRQGKAWRVQGQARLSEFDPRLWWAGPAGSAWQRTGQRLNASLDADLLLGAQAGWPRGEASMKLGDSLMMGVPVSGEARLKSGAEATLTAKMLAGGNQLSLSGQLPPAPAAERWTGSVQAGDLSRLAPLLAMLPVRADQPAITLSGKLEGAFTAQGRWPLLSIDTQLKAQNLQSNLLGPDARIGQADLSAALGTQAGDALSVKLELRNLNLQAARIEQLKLQLGGSWQQHQLSLDMSSGLKAPPWLNALLPGASLGDAATGSRAALKLQGGLSQAPAAWLARAQAVDWTGQLQQLDLRGTGPASGTAPAWISGRELGLKLQWSGDGLLSQALAQPGRVEIAGAALRWSLLRWQAPSLAGQSALIEAQAELEPLAVAPLLARWQPDFGWGGNLLLGGRAKLRMGSTVDIDIELLRSQGDLQVTDDAGPQALGLSELRLGLTAQNGVWHFTQAIAGSNLGVVGGAISSRTSPQAWWPAPDAPLEGVLEAQVANLGTWGGWIPAGWRLAGTTRAGITLKGKVGAPEIVGQASGHDISVRNLLQGVDVREGEFAMSLNGATAKLDFLRAKAGSGTLQLEGNAELGATPQAQLTLKASKFALLARVDRRIVTSGQAQLALKANELKLNGKFTVDEGLIDFTRSDAPSLDDDVIVLRSEQPLPEALANGSKRDRVIIVDLGVDLGRQLRLRGRGLDTLLRGELRLSQQAGKPTLQGTVRAENGTYAAYGQKLEIERGDVIFGGQMDNPRLDVIATRPNTDTRVGVTVTGTARNPRIRLFSEPELSETEKLSWLVLGRGSDGLGRTDTALLQRAALALLTGEGEGATAKLVQSLGLDELSLKQSDGEVRETIVRLGKQLSRRWYVGYERGLNSTTGNWQLIYRIAQRFTLRAQSGSDNSMDLIWQWKWN